MTVRRVAMVPAVLCVVVAGCATPEAPRPTPQDDDLVDAARVNAAPSPLDDLRRRWLARAAVAERSGDLATAALALEVLVLIDPPAYAQRLADLQTRIATQQWRQVMLARQEMQKGRLEAAEQLYLAALALRPQDAEIAQALRDIDRARNRRDHLGRPSRETLTRRSPVPATTSAADTARLEAAMEIEHAKMLATQGEDDDAIAMLEGLVARKSADNRARALLADLLYRKAVAMRTTDPAGARAALERALRAEPGHLQARALQQQIGAGGR